MRKKSDTTTVSLFECATIYCESTVADISLLLLRKTKGNERKNKTKKTK